MPITGIEIEGYRSLWKVRFPVDELSVYVGGNGVGKTNLYRAIELLCSAAEGNLGQMIGQEGGIRSMMFAGAPKTKNKPPRIRLCVEFGEIDYELVLGFPAPGEAYLNLDASIKLETIGFRQGSRRHVMLERKGPAYWLVDEEGRRQQGATTLLNNETALSAIRDAERYPELTIVRDELQGARFYHQMRTDPASPIRHSPMSLCTPNLDSDGGNLAAVFATIFEVSLDTEPIQEAIDDAFPGASLEVSGEASRCDFALHFPGGARPFSAHELSDGTLSYLALVGALCAYRLPSFVALNEPEANLHPSLMPAVARLIGRAREKTRVWVVTHSEASAQELEKHFDVRVRRVTHDGAQTQIEGLSSLGVFAEDDED